MSAFESSPSQDGSYYISMAFGDFALAVSAVFSNAAFLVTVYRDPNRCLRTAPATFLMINLSASDMVGGVVSGFCSGAFNIAELTGSVGTAKVTISVILLVAVLTIIVSSYTMVAMSLDRWFAVSSPFKHRAGVSGGKMKVFIAAIWTYAFLFTALFVVGVPRDIVTLLYCHLHLSLPIVVLAVIYWQTYRALRFHSSQVQTLSQGNVAINVAHTIRERKVTSAFLLVLMVFYSVFFPHFVSLHVILFCPPCIVTTSFKVLNSLSTKLLLANYSTNPFIWAWRIPKFRRAFRSVVINICSARNYQGNIVSPLKVLKRS